MLAGFLIFESSRQHHVFFFFLAIGLEGNSIAKMNAGVDFIQTIPAEYLHKKFGLLKIEIIIAKQILGTSVVLIASEIP